MRTDQNIRLSNIKNPDKARKPGRPRAIPVELEPVVTMLYRQGYEYRTIADILSREHATNPHYSSVRQAVKRLGLLVKANIPN